MIGTIIVNHGEVSTLTQTLIANMQSDVVGEARNRFKGIAEEKMRVDGATNASLLTAIEYNIEKTADVCQALERLLLYIRGASEQLHAGDTQMASELVVQIGAAVGATVGAAVAAKTSGGES